MEKIDKIVYQIPGGYEINSVAGVPTRGISKVDDILSTVTTILLISVIVIALFFLIWGGIMWITSGGDKAKVDAARNKIVYSIIGLVVAFSAFLIVNIVFQFLGITFSLS